MKKLDVIKAYPNIFTKISYKKPDVIKLLFDNFKLIEDENNSLIKIIKLMPNTSTIKIIMANYPEKMEQIINQNNLQRNNISSNSLKYHQYESLVARFFRNKLNICPNDNKFTTRKFCDRQCWKEYMQKVKQEKLKQKRIKLLKEPVIDHTKEFDEHVMDDVSDDKFIKAIQSCLKPGEKLFSERRAKIAKTKYEKQHNSLNKSNETNNKFNDIFKPVNKGTDVSIMARALKSNIKDPVDPYQWGIMSPKQIKDKEQYLEKKRSYEIHNMIKNMKPTSKHEEEIANQYISDNDLDNLVNIFENSNGDMTQVTSYLDNLIS